MTIRILLFFYPGLEDTFAKSKWGTEVVDYGVPYDFESIMHYPFTAFSKNGKPTIRNIVPMNGEVPYVELSDGDAKQTNAMYKCDGKDFKGTMSTYFLSNDSQGSVPAQPDHISPKTVLHVQ